MATKSTIRRIPYLVTHCREKISLSFVRQWHMKKKQHIFVTDNSNKDGFFVQSKILAISNISQMIALVS